MRHAKLKRNEIKIGTTHGNFLPVHERQHLLEQIIQDLEMHDTPKLVRSAGVTNFIVFSTTVVGALIFFILSLHAIATKNPFTAFILNSPILGGCLTAGITCVLLMVLTESRRNEFAPSMATVGEFSRWIVANNAPVLATPQGKFTREQVRTIVRHIVIEILGCEDMYSENADFVKDLGLS